MMQDPKDFLIECGYFTDPTGEWWTHTDFEKCSGSYEWFSLAEAYKQEFEYQNESTL